MAKHEPGDIVTYHFVINKQKGGRSIQAWSDNKDLVKLYMDFHRCKNFKVKTISNYIEEIIKICEENCHDEIKLFNINTRNPKRKGEVIAISVPATETEITFINEETNTFLTSMINYGKLNEVMPYLKKKDQKALHDIFLEDITKKVVHERASKLVQLIQLDQLMVLYKLFPDNFGI